MGKKIVNPIIHIFVPEDSARCSNRKGVSCELNYFTYLFKRPLSESNWQLSMYTYRQKQKFMAYLKKEGKNKKSNDLFFVILDADLVTNPAPSEIDRKVKQIYNEYKEMKEKNSKIKFILSSRCWEVWMCMHNDTPYMKPFSTQGELNKDVKENYKKEGSWYKSNAPMLFETYKKASKNSKLSRKIQKLNMINFQDEESIQCFLKNCDQQATFVDVLVDELDKRIVCE